MPCNWKRAIAKTCFQDYRKDFQGRMSSPITHDDLTDKCVYKDKGDAQKRVSNPFKPRNGPLDP